MRNRFRKKSRSESVKICLKLYRATHGKTLAVRSTMTKIQRCQAAFVFFFFIDFFWESFFFNYRYFFSNIYTISFWGFFFQKKPQGELPRTTIYYIFIIFSILISLVVFSFIQFVSLFFHFKLDIYIYIYVYKM